MDIDKKTIDVDILIYVMGGGWNDLQLAELQSMLQYARDLRLRVLAALGVQGESSIDLPALIRIVREPERDAPEA